MAIYRVHKNNDYTVMSNTHLRDKNLSLKAKGLLSVMLSLPDDWDYSIAGLVAICKENKIAIETALKELKDTRYLTISRTPTENGKFEYEYDIYEKPHTEDPCTEKPCTEKPCTEKPCTEKPCTEKPCTENLPLNKVLNKSSTKKQSTKELNTEEKEGKTLSRFTPPPLEEVKKYCEERGDKVDPQIFFDYYSSIGWKVGKNPMKDWRACVRTWENREKKEEQQPKEIDYEKALREEGWGL